MGCVSAAPGDSEVVTSPLIVVCDAVDVGAPVPYWLFGDRNGQLPVGDLAFQRYLMCRALAERRSTTSSRHGMHSLVSWKSGG